MYSLRFPDMFSRGMSTSIVEDHDATVSNLKLVLLSDKTGLFGDPEFGSNLRRRLFSQNDRVLRDLIVDDIYTTILLYIPQLIVERDKIKVTTDGVDVFAEVSGINLLDMQPDLYTINLTSLEV